MILFIISYIVALLNFLILLYWRTSCVWSNENKFPTRGHILLIMLASLIPGMSFLVIAVMLGIFFGTLSVGELELKKTKFNHYWFDTDLDEDGKL